MALMTRSRHSSQEQLVAVHIPFDPFQHPDRCDTMRCVVLPPGDNHETPEFIVDRWCGGRLRPAQRFVMPVRT
jgi:hypothetical protein